MLNAKLDKILSLLQPETVKFESVPETPEPKETAFLNVADLIKEEMQENKPALTEQTEEQHQTEEKPAPAKKKKKAAKKAAPPEEK